MVRRAAPPLAVPVCLSIASYDDFLEAHRLLIENRFPTPLLTARQVQEGIWISRNVSLHPSAVLTAPVFIGENCRVGEAVQLGPMATLGHDSVLDRQSVVRNAVVLPGSYVGEALDLETSIVDGGRLINVTLGAELAIDEAFLLGSVSGGRKLSPRRLAGRIFAGLLLLVFLPVLLLTLLVCYLAGRRPIVCRREFVRLPAANNPERWQTGTLPLLAAAPPESGVAHFLLWFLPGLFSVVRGRIGLVGVSARSKAEVESLSPDWRAMYLRGEAGLITEAFVRHGAYPSAEDQHACDVFYAVSAGLALDAAILWGYAARVCGLGAARAKSGATTAGGQV